MNSQEGRTIVITGGTGGIGHQSALGIAKTGARLLIIAPWRLTWALLPALTAAGDARVLNITGGNKPAAIDPDDLQAEKGFRRADDLRPLEEHRGGDVDGVGRAARA